MPEQIDIKQFRNTLGSFMTGVTVVTTKTRDGNLKGFTANSFTSVSLDPPLVLVCLANSSLNYDDFTENDSFAVNILAEDQRSLSNTFASPVEDRFADISVNTKVTGSPIIANSLAYLDCELHDTSVAGDHVILIGRVVDFDSTDANPLGYFKGSYVELGMSTEAAIAAESSSLNSIVSVFAEDDGYILMHKNDQNIYSLPSSSHLAGENGLLDSLKNIGIELENSFLFSVFENTNEGVTNTCYRSIAKGQLKSEAIIWVDINNVPFELIKDTALKSMIKRFVKERQRDAFGVYVGDSQEGQINTLVNNN